MVEDNPADFHLTKLAFGEVGLTDQLLHFTDGALYHDFLHVHGFTHIRFILLDLSLPGLDGYTLLRSLRKETIDCPPVIVFTTSNNVDDIQKCYELGANAFITKPLDINDYFDTIKGICDFWAPAKVFELKLPN